MPHDSADPESAPTATRGQLRFAITFAGLATVLSLLYYFPYASGGAVDRAMSAYLSAYASAVGAVVHLFDSTVRVSGQDVIGRFGFRVARDCDAMEAMILYGCAVVAWPASLRLRIAGVAAGIATVFAVNVVRLSTMYWIGTTWPSAFDFAHRELWPALLVVVVVVAFVAWVAWTGSYRAEATRAPG
jgi:exosortase/archaeosortase family protein